MAGGDVGFQDGDFVVEIVWAGGEGFVVLAHGLGVGGGGVEGVGLGLLGVGFLEEGLLEGRKGLASCRCSGVCGGKGRGERTASSSGEKRGSVVGTVVEAAGSEEACW